MLLPAMILQTITQLLKKLKFSIEDLLSKWDQIGKRILTPLLKKSLMQNNIRINCVQRILRTERIWRKFRENTIVSLAHHIESTQIQKTSQTYLLRKVLRPDLDVDSGTVM